MFDQKKWIDRYRRIHKTKEVQEVNVREKLNKMGKCDIVVLKDGAALSNPGPAWAGVVIYVDGYDANPILLKKV